MDADVPLRPPGGAGLWVRPYRAGDHAVVVALVDGDWLPGQHPVGLQFPPPGLERLQEPEILVACAAGGQVAGVVCIGVRPADGAGLIVQLHGWGDFEVIAVLVAAARSRLGGRTLYAFTGPATATGIPGLPIEHRPTTARVLIAAGFTPACAQRYFLRDLTTPPGPPWPLPGYPPAQVTTITGPPGWLLKLTGPDGHHTATAILRAPTQQTADMAVLWQLTVRHTHRRQGLATHLLTHCLHHAALHGAEHLTADTPDGDIPATRLLTSTGFLPLDTLTVYHRPP
ncbi:GNAT family N-acetyltransferase [Streptomyces sp. NPDC087908]|uniref:GNAT family N-acetyltransferase n=1 Tax=Streptomyces sp. NPDC087908 TaxID=3365820 RepID=UPI00381D3CF8